MKTYKILTKGYTATILTDEKSINSLIQLLEHLDNVIEVYEFGADNEGAELIRRVTIKI